MCDINISLSCENTVSTLSLAFTKGMKVGFLRFWLSLYGHSSLMFAVSTGRVVLPHRCIPCHKICCNHDIQIYILDIIHVMGTCFGEVVGVYDTT